MRILSPSEYGSDAGEGRKSGLEQHLLVGNDATSVLRAVDNKRSLSIGVRLHVADMDGDVLDVIGRGIVLVVDVLVADVDGTLEDGLAADVLVADVDGTLEDGLAADVLVADVDGTREDGLVADGGGIVLVADVDGTLEDGLAADVLVADVDGT